MEKEYVIMQVEDAGSRREPTYYSLKRAEIWDYIRSPNPLKTPLTDDESRGIFTSEERAEYVLEELLKTPTRKQFTIIKLYSTFYRQENEKFQFKK